MSEKDLSNQENAAANEVSSQEQSDKTAPSSAEQKEAEKPAAEEQEQDAVQEEAASKAEEKEQEAEAPAADATPEAEENKAPEVEPAPETKEEITPAEQAVVEETSPTEETAPAAEEPVAHDEFDWDAGTDNYDLYPEKERHEWEQLYEDTLTSLEENTIVKGRVESLSESDAVINIGFKSDGMISTSEFRDMEELNEGDEVEVYVEKKEDNKGQLVLSRRKAKLMRAWETIVDAHDNDKVVKGSIVSKTKGGLIVNIMGLETFLPGSQIDVKPIIDYDAYVGKTMDFKVVKINEAIKNAVVSHKALIESDLEEQRQAIISQLEKGQVLEGTVKNITDFGAFIDLGGVDGLLYITDISWGRISHPSEILELNQEVNVVVLDFDDEKKRISLGMKQLEPHPWDVLGEDISEGAKVKGKIVNIEDYGAFLEIKPGVEGLIHVSEVSWSNQPINAKEYFTLGEEYEAIIVTIDREERKMSLSIKQLHPDPWDNIEEKYPEGSRHSGEVKNITPYGVFVELDEYIGGMVHISDLSWIKRFNHPSEYIKVGETLDTVVLEIDKEGRKIALGHKQLEEDPWDTFENVFPVGSVHEATLLRRDDKGGIVQLPYGLEAFAPAKHLKKEDGTQVEADETLEFKILEFDRDDKRIIVSHTRIHTDAKRSEMVEEKKSRQQQQKRTKRAVQNINKKQEKTTLGELGVLDQLKEQMEEDEKKTDSKAKKSEDKKQEEKGGDEEE